MKLTSWLSISAIGGIEPPYPALTHSPCFNRNAMQGFFRSGTPMGDCRQYTTINRHKNMRKSWMTLTVTLSKPIFDCEVGHSLTTCCSGSGTRTREANAAAYETAQIPTSDIPLFLNSMQIYGLFLLPLSAGNFYWAHYRIRTNATWLRNMRTTAILSVLFISPAYRIPVSQNKVLQPFPLKTVPMAVIKVMG